MTPFLQTVNGRNEMRLSGYIIPNDDQWLYDRLECEATCPNDVRGALAGLQGRPLTVVIGTGYGGDIFAGADIYDEFMRYPGQVDFIITSLAASEHSVIPMASAKPGNSLKMSPLAMMMLHNVQSSANGDYRDMEHEAKRLKTANKTIISAFQRKTGKSEDELQAILNEETWLDAGSALEMGLIDGILYDEDFPEDSKPPPALMNAVGRQVRALYNSALLPADGKTMSIVKGSVKPDAVNRHDDMSDAYQYAAAALELEKHRFNGGNGYESTV